MPAATRLGDLGSGHDDCVPTKLLTGSNNVFINKRPAGRVSDKYSSHYCKDHEAHEDIIVSGSSSVFINGLGASRIGDSISPEGIVSEGSSDVFIG